MRRQQQQQSGRGGGRGGGKPKPQIGSAAKRRRGAAKKAGGQVNQPRGAIGKKAAAQQFMSRDAARRLRLAKAAARAVLERGGTRAEAAQAAQVFGSMLVGSDSDGDEDDSGSDSPKLQVAAEAAAAVRASDDGDAVVQLVEDEMARMSLKK